MKTLSEFNTGKISSKENDGITESLYKVISLNTQKEIVNQEIHINNTHKNYITSRYTDEYQKHFCIGRNVKITDSGLEYANIILNKNLTKDESLTTLMRDAIKQTICFEIIKKDSDIKNLSKEDFLEIHKKAEILASKIDHKDLNYQNRYTFENVKKEVYENTHDFPQEMQLNEREISKLTDIIQNERALELQKQHDLQRQQSRGCEIEI